MKKVGFVYDDIFLTHEMPFGHPESKDRLIAINKAVRQSPLWDKLIHLKPERTIKEDILLVHTLPYYEKALKFTGYYDTDTYISPTSVEAAHFAAGAVKTTIEKCKSGELDRAFCAVRPPGHHAEAGRAMGFCIFNNVAIGARYAQKIGYKKVMIIDFDVHHGNGTQHIFEDDDSVFYFSTHQYPHYPGTGGESETGIGKGKGFTYNAPMHHGAGDKEFLAVYQDLLPGVLSRFSPDIVIVSSGYDLHVKDPLAGLRVTDEGIRSMIRSILQACPGIPYIFCLEGGYNLEALCSSVLITLEELLYCE